MGAMSCRWALVVVLAFVLLIVAYGAKAGTSSKSGNGKASHAVPRGKGAKGGKGKGSGKGSSGGLTSSITRSLGGGFMYKVFREMKTAFGSELEALALTLTRPSDAAVSEASLEELQQVYEGEYENPQFTVSLLAKLSRKLVEPNVFTKIKSLLCLHRLMEGAGDKSQEVMLQCIRSLRSELDSKVGQPFFAVEGVKEAGDTASNVGEAEATEVAREYVGYVFDYIEYKGEIPRKLGREDATVDRVEALLSLVEQGLAVEDLCEGSAKGGVLRQCSEGCRRNRAWLLKQAARLHELEAWGEDGEAKKELEAVLREFKVKFAPSPSSPSSPSSLSSPSSPATGAGAAKTEAEAKAEANTAERVSASLDSKASPAPASADEEEEEGESAGEHGEASRQSDEMFTLSALLETRLLHRSI